MMEATRKNGKDGDEPRRRGWGGSTCAFPCRLTGASIASRGRTCTTPRGGGGGGGRALESLIVTIVYSGGDGTIHAVHREARCRNVDNGGSGGVGGTGRGGGREERWGRCRYRPSTSITCG
jgi:hypothetical protein